MILKSYSKINFSLSVNSKLKTGLHEIQSYYCLINLCDKIKISKIKEKKDNIFFQGPFVKYIEKSNNSIINTLNLLRKFKVITSYYSVTIIKNIPVFSGLGGGTSNAAFILKFLLKKKNIDKHIYVMFPRNMGTLPQSEFIKYIVLELSEACLLAYVSQSSLVVGITHP